MSSSKQIAVHLKSVKHFLDDTRQNINTISGNLENIHKTLTKRESVLIKQKFFGRKWIYKVNENEKIKKNYICVKSLRNIILSGVLFILLISGILIAFGPKLLDMHLSKNDTYLFKTVPNVKLNTTKVVMMEKNIKSIQNTNNTVAGKQDNSTTLNCHNCSNDEICLQNTSEIFPKCVTSRDVADPTGCGGLCVLEKQICKRLDKNLSIYSCIDIEIFHCEENQFKCENIFMCIPFELKCNGIINCIDYSDELNCDCDLVTHFRCGGNISCIPNSRKCDGSVDCWDATDETSCIKECQRDYVPCYNGECIEKEFFCNGRYDCLDKSDEPAGCAVEMKNDTNT